MMDDRKDLVRKNLRSGRRRRALQEEDSGRQNLEGFSGFWARTGKNLFQTIFFGVTIVLICFVGQEPPYYERLGRWHQKMSTVIVHLLPKRGSQKRGRGMD